MKKWKVLITSISVYLLIFALQFIIFDYNNPPIKNEPNWDSQKTKETFKSLCADCHSNETRYPWYSYVPPFSLLVHYDIHEGREHFNSSEYNLEDGVKSAYEFNKGEMPLRVYTLIHDHPALYGKAKMEFIKGLEATFGKYEKNVTDENLYNHPEE